MAPAPACILIVEDHNDNRFLMTLLLRNQGYGVVAASSFAEGLSLAQDTNFDLYLLDDRLGDGCGQELREKLRELHPAIPALFFTANSYTPDRIDTLRQNGDDYVLKPSPTDNVLAAVADLLMTSKATRDAASLNVL
jgi:DNA-binding response OmpR family regulator